MFVSGMLLGEISPWFSVPGTLDCWPVADCSELSLVGLTVSLIRVLETLVMPALVLLIGRACIER